VKPFLKYLLFSLVTLLLFILFVELSARVVGGRFLSNKFFLEKGEGLIKAQVPFDAKGQHFYDPKPAHTFRIFCLGGSSTYGLGFHERTAFPERLGVLLNSQEGSTKAEVINLGVVSFTSDGVLRMLKQALEYEPDLVIIHMGHNELPFRFSLNQVAHPCLNRIWSFMSEKSRVFNALFILVHKLTVERQYISVEQWLYQGDDRAQFFPPELR